MRTLSWRVGVSLVVTGLACLPLPALAGTQPTMGITAYEQPDHHIEVTILDPSAAVTQITAHITPTTAGAPVPDLTAFQPGPNPNSWVSQAPVAVSVLGRYAIGIDATDSAGNSASNLQAGNLYYLVTPSAKFVWSRTSYDYEHQTATVTGTVIGTWPDGTQHPLPDHAIGIYPPNGKVITVTTDANAQFTWSGDVVTAEKYGGLWVDVYGSDTIGEWESPQQYPSLTALDTRMTASVTPTRMSGAGTATITGTLGYHSSDGTWKPLAGRSLTDDNGIVQATTGADGTFTAQEPVSGQAGRYIWYLGYQPSALDWWYFKTSKAPALEVDVPDQDVFSDFQVTYSPFAVVTVSGFIQNGQFEHTNRDLLVQYSPTGTGGWRTIRTLHTETGQQQFSTSFTYLTSGYWRVYTTGDVNYRPSVSPVVKAWRWNTRIDRFRVSTRSVRRRGHLTVSGTLNRAVDMTHRKNYGNQPIQILFRPRGSKIWYLLAQTRTDSKGRFSKQVTAYESGYYAAQFPGGSDTFACWTGDAPVYVATTSAALVVQSLPALIVTPPAWSGSASSPAAPGD